VRILAFLAALWLTAGQTVSFSNCCRGTFCSQKDDCPPCGSAPEDGRGCCEDEGEGRASDTPCIHLEPSMDVVEEASSPRGEAPAPSGFLDPGGLNPALHEAPAHRASQGGDPPLRPERPPLYLLDRSLRI